MRALKWCFGAVDLTMAGIYWGLVFHSHFFYGAQNANVGLFYAFFLVAFLGTKILLSNRLVDGGWARKRPWAFGFLSVSSSIYLIFFSYALVGPFQPGIFVGIVSAWKIFAVPFGFFVVGAPVLAPIWLALSLGLGCCARRKAELL